jgi:hypothetical protein
VEYDAADGNRYKRTTVIKNKNSRTWKTVTLSLPNASFLNWQTSGMDFRIYNGGRSDLSVRFVRVIKLKVVYLVVADNVSRLLPTHLRRVSQPVISTRNAFSIPRLTLLAYI